MKEQHFQQISKTNLAEQLFDSLRLLYTCPYSGQIMLNPVINSNGQCFDQKSKIKNLIEKNFSEKPDYDRSISFEGQKLIQNSILKSIIHKTQQFLYPQILTIIKQITQQLQELKLQNSSLKSQNQKLRQLQSSFIYVPQRNINVNNQNDQKTFQVKLQFDSDQNISQVKEMNLQKQNINQNQRNMIQKDVKQYDNPYIASNFFTQKGFLRSNLLKNKKLQTIITKIVHNHHVSDIQSLISQIISLQKTIGVNKKTIASYQRKQKKFTDCQQYYRNLIQHKQNLNLSYQNKVKKNQQIKLQHEKSLKNAQLLQEQIIWRMNEIQSQRTLQFNRILRYEQNIIRLRANMFQLQQRNVRFKQQNQKIFNQATKYANKIDQLKRLTTELIKYKRNYKQFNKTIMQLMKCCQINQFIINCYNCAIQIQKISQTQSNRIQIVKAYQNLVLQQVDNCCKQLQKQHKAKLLTKLNQEDFSTYDIRQLKNQFLRLKSLSKCGSPYQISNAYKCKKYPINSQQISLDSIFNHQIGYQLNAQALLKSWRSKQYLNLSWIPVKSIKTTKSKMTQQQFKLFMFNSSCYPNILQIDFKQNSITSLTQTSLQRFSKLKKVDLQKNPLDLQSINQIIQYQQRHPDVRITTYEKPNK